MVYKSLVRPLFFLLNPEKAHSVALTGLSVFGKFYPTKLLIKNLFEYKSEKLKRNIGGLIFQNPVGLAAGFDKDAEAFEELGLLGFGFIEIGTVTPKSQDGNPQPRLFRLKKDKALINRMGFNNSGVDVAIEKLKKRNNKNLIIGGNIGKNKNTPLNQADSDYIISFEKLFPYVDYFVINVSSPNTPNLRKLQDKEPLTKLINKLLNLNNKKNSPKPVFLKIAPDLTLSQLDDIIDIANNTALTGLIATNTTIDRTNLITPKSDLDSIGNGGLSGKPLVHRSTEIIRYLRQNLDNDKKIIGVGGISKPEDAIEKLNAGADLIQIFTGFIYEGPSLIKRINKAIVSKSK